MDQHHHHCSVFVRALHDHFAVMSRYWLRNSLKECRLEHLADIITVFVKEPVRVVLDSRHLCLFDVPWAKLPLRLFSRRGCCTLRSLLLSAPVPFKVRIDNLFKARYSHFKYNSYVDARFRRDALIMAFAAEIMNMFPLQNEKTQCAPVVARTIEQCVSSHLPVTHPLYRQLTKKLRAFYNQNKK